MKNRKIKAGRQGGEEKTGKQHGVHHEGAQLWRGPIAGGPIVGEQHCGGTLLWGDLLWGEPRCGGTLLCVGLLRGDLLWGNTKWALIKLTTQCSFHGLCRSPHTRVPPFPSRTLSVPRPDWKTGKKGKIGKTCTTHRKSKKN